jgi:hypothetical protein
VQEPSSFMWWRKSLSPIQHWSSKANHIKNLQFGGALVLRRTLPPRHPALAMEESFVC